MFQDSNAAAVDYSVPYIGIATSTIAASITGKWALKRSDVTTRSWLAKKSRRSEPRHIDAAFGIRTARGGRRLRFDRFGGQNETVGRPSLTLGNLCARLLFFPPHFEH